MPTAQPSFTTHRGEKVPVSQLRAGDVIQILNVEELGAQPHQLGALALVQYTYPYSPGTFTLQVVAPPVGGGALLSYNLYGPRPGLRRFQTGIPSSTLLHRLIGSHSSQLREKWVKQLRSARNYPQATIRSTGCDPEIFVVDGDGQVIPAWKFLGDKAHGTYGGYTTRAYWDGWQAEFAPAQGSCHEFLGDRIHSGLKHILRRAQKFNPTARLTTQSVIPVSPVDLQGADEKYVQFGCSPSLNVYGAVGGVGMPARDLPIRFAGAHIHFGFPAGSLDIPSAVRAADAIAGVASVALFEGLENPQRRQFYGLAGEYRTPAHGLEYRTLSPAWLCHPAIAHLMLDMTRFSLGWGPYLREAGLDDAERIQRIINTCDATGAREFISEHEWVYTDWAKSRYYNDTLKSTRLLLRALREGVGFLVDPEAIESNWYLTDGEWEEQSHGPDCQFRYLIENFNEAATSTSKGASA